ncbi:hypothetical protein U0C82_02185 [Fulvimarina sp. 2208YS6-2-32]|uniref:Uncharacterized protein n=1 Tax=Fulvimarina uroteuthidis TaxID=3098149 RepID=A0ABU5HXU1_9HYPH|nr:hypothetical protein [Fulvimarina sp. 2208YS6-2-32]MDY8107959.1 hypothetical protein [Fulvimarina sp. 2208YS6-2-32]
MQPAQSESPPITRPSRLFSVALLATAFFTILRDWFAVPGSATLAASCVGLLLLVAVPSASWSRRMFVAIGAALALAAIATRAEWRTLLLDALGQGAFIATFFVALATLRAPAAVSPAIMRCGEYLASQPPGKRYIALTGGGHLFALILNYGSIQLLGGLTESIAGREPNEELREIRNRRMLLAIQRGFCSSLLWSPLAFAMAITTSIIPGASWSAAAGFALANAALFMGIGWALDTIVKPVYSGPPPVSRTVKGSIADLKPLLVLLFVIFLGVGLLELATGLRIVSVVMVFVPLASLSWLILEALGDAAPARKVASQLKTLAFRELPSYGSEIVLLIMAGIIGSLGAALAVPILEKSGLDLSALPVWLIVAAPVWLIPLFGQLGMNPILSVSLFAPILPDPGAIGVSPIAIVCAITAGWALAGATSPFTATTMLIGRLGHTTAFRVGADWNRTFFLVAASALTVTALMIAGLAPV